MSKVYSIFLPVHVLAVEEVVSENDVEPKRERPRGAR